MNQAAVFSKNKHPAQLIAIVMAIIAGLTMIYCRIGYDVAVLALMLAAFFCIGSFFPMRGIQNRMERRLLQIAVGMAVYGLTVYVLLLLKWGGRTQYLLLMLFPIVVWLYKRQKEGKPFCLPQLQTCSSEIAVFSCFAIILALFYLAYASAPVDSYDALTGHLPMTMYAARNGAFNINICESMTYAQTGVLFYAYSTVLAAFSAYKGMTLLNVVLFMLIIATGTAFAKHFFEQVNPLCMVILFASVPMFFEFSTIMYIEMLPIYMAFSAFLMFVDLTSKQGWENMPYVALFFGAAVISKLTIAYTLVFPGIIAIVLFWQYSWKNRLPVGKSLKRFIGSGLLFFGIVAIPCCVAWYWYGNPVFPWFNGIFKSPYFWEKDFVDPFNSSPLSLSLGSILKMVFQTDLNVEMHPGGLGIFLLFIPLIPVAWILLKKKTFIIWGIVPVLAYMVSTLFTYNLRYYMSIFMLEVILLATSICVITAKIVGKQQRRWMISSALAVVISIPGIVFIGRFYPIAFHLTNISDEISVSVYSSLLDEIPSGKRVFSSESFKGDYDGYLSPNTWHGLPWQRVTEITGISKEQYISGFDYYICNLNNESEAGLLNSCMEQGVELDLVKSENGFGLYKIQNTNQPLASSILREIDTVLETPVESIVSKPVIESFAVQNSHYRITQDVENTGSEDVDVRFQINWMDENGELLDVGISTYVLAPGERLEKTSQELIAPEGASTGILFVCPHEDRPINVYSYSLESFNTQGELVSQVENILREKTLLGD